MLNWLSARTRLAAGLVAIVGCMMLAAITLGLVPDRANIERQHRAQLCETLAINYSVLANRNDISGIRQSLQAITNRHPEILSAGVRDRFGRMMVDVKEHDEVLAKRSEIGNFGYSRSRPRISGQAKICQCRAEIRAGGSQGIAGWIQHPWTLLMAFVNGAVFRVIFPVFGLHVASAQSVEGGSGPCSPRT